MNLYIVDDDEAVRRSLGLLLLSRGHTVQAFDSGEAFLENAHTEQAGCVILDVRLNGMSGVQVFEALREQASALLVIFLSGHGDIPMAVQAMKDGAFDFLQKPFRDQELIDRINAALKQDAENRAELQKHADLKRRMESLTPREREVMALVVDGKANKVIAIDLGLSERTVEIHRANVMEKMGARSVAHLVKMNLMIAGEA